MIAVVLRGGTAVGPLPCIPSATRGKIVQATPPPPPAASAATSSLSIGSPDLAPLNAETTQKRRNPQAQSLPRTPFPPSNDARMIFVLYLGRDWEADEFQSKKTTPSGRWARTKARFTDLFDVLLQQASMDRAASATPSKSPPKPYTLLVSMDDLLGIDKQVGGQPNVQVLTISSQHNYLWLIYTARSVDGKIVKDLSYLNRDLSKVILLDTREEHVSTHPENSIALPKWTHTPGDKGLVAIVPFLESIAIYKPPDVNPILQGYHGKERANPSSGGSTELLFGMSTEPSHSPIPPTYLEQKRAEA
ncbi:hypothetical protein OG21DRAFT_1522951 [Imleria badia]|nr:hypothetical protein OG21DRAFT_1522951 [Imleria badia]